MATYLVSLGPQKRENTAPSPPFLWCDCSLCADYSASVPSLPWALVALLQRLEVDLQCFPTLPGDQVNPETHSHHLSLQHLPLHRVSAFHSANPVTFLPGAKSTAPCLVQIQCPLVKIKLKFLTMTYTPAPGPRVKCRPPSHSVAPLAFPQA